MTKPILSMKTCCCCKAEKPLTDFGFRSDTGKLMGACKVCRNKQINEWKARNTETVKALARKYYETHKEDHKEKHQKWTKDWQLRNKQKIKEGRDRRRFELTDGVICENLNIKARDTPIQFIEAKRIHLQIKRKLKELKA